MTLTLYFNPFDVLLYKCSCEQHMRCTHDIQKIHEVLYDVLPLASCLIRIIADYTSLTHDELEYIILQKLINSLWYKPPFTIIKNDKLINNQIAL